MHPRRSSIHLCAAALVLGSATLGSAQTSTVAESTPIRDLHATSDQRGMRLTQGMLQGHWTVGDRTCAEKARLMVVDSEGKCSSAWGGGQIIVLPDGRIRSTSEDGTRIQEVREMSRDYIIFIDSEFGNEFHWRRC